MSTYDARRQRATAVIEALRSGIPTRLSTRELPDLRAKLTDLIRQDLEQLAAGKRPEGRLAWGPYGQGKTHALTTVEHVALDLGLAVSRVSLSREISCHHLLNFYGRVAATIRTPDPQSFGISRALSRKTFGDLAKSDLRHPDRYGHPLPRLILEDYFFSSGEDQDLLYGDLSGTRLPMPEFKRIHRDCRGNALPKFEVNFRVTDHGSAYFGVMADTIALCGYKGWVILIDEVELIGRLGKVGRLQAYRNLQWLLNWTGEMIYPIYTFGVVASSLRNDVWFRGTAGGSATKQDSTVIPQLAAEKLGNAAASETQAFFQHAISPACPTIKPLEQSDLMDLLSKIVELHGITYDWQPNLDLTTLLVTVGSQPIRTYIRAALEALDLSYLYREKVTLKPAQLVESSLEENEEFFAQESSGEE
jgi:hypothetical protein